MNRERRKGLPPVPGELEKLLNNIQLITLREMQNFGWTVELVRRPLFTTPIAVLRSPDGKKMALIEEDGTVNHDPDIVIR